MKCKLCKERESATRGAGFWGQSRGTAAQREDGSGLCPSDRAWPARANGPRLARDRGSGGGTGQGGLRQGERWRRQVGRSKLLALRSSDGLLILVGKNSRQNEEVTFQQATPDDLWLHARGVPGAHVVKAEARRCRRPPCARRLGWPPTPGRAARPRWLSTTPSGGMCAAWGPPFRTNSGR